MNKLKKIIFATVDLFKRKRIVPITCTVGLENEFNGRVALISGGTGGIGLSIARRLIESGCKVIITGTNEIKLKDLQKELGENASSLKLDYSNPDDFEDIIIKGSQIYGGIDIFINSVGVHTENVDFWNMTSTEFDRVMSINLKGSFFACQAMGKYMKENGIKGNILLISSSRGSEPVWSPYGISKWGLKGMTEGLAQLLLPYGIIVNAIAPGSTATSLIGVKEEDNIYSIENKAGRYVMPDEVASLAKLLVSDAGRMIVGEMVHISAGRGIFDIR